MRLRDISDTLSELAQEEESVSIGRIMEKLGNRGYAPFLIVPALIEISPIGGVPGVPTLLAAIILIVAGQMILGRHHLWLPKIVRKRSLKSNRVAGALNKLDPMIGRIDSWFHNERMAKLTKSPVTNIAAFVCLLLALSVPPLEFIPFASTAPMAAIALIGMALLVQDGFLMLIALSVSILSFTTLGFLLGN